MADDAIIALFDLVQDTATEKIFVCDLCQRQRFCASCSKEGRRLLAAERRIAGGVTPIGSEVKCQDCSAVFIKTGNRHFRCSVCAKAAAFSQTVAAARTKRKAEAGSKPVAISYCEKCKAVFPFQARKRFCDPCAVLNKKEYSARWATENPQSVLAKAARYHEKNSDLINLRKADRRKLNPAPDAAYRKTASRKESVRRHYEKNRENPTAQVNHRMSHGIRLSLKGKKAGRQWESLVDYTLADLVSHLERQFSDGMSWENMGKWHIDHRIPKSSFKYETPECPGFKAAWALSNLQPLWALDNFKKHAKMTLLI